MSEHLASILSAKLDREVRSHFDRAFRAMWRDLDRLVALQDAKLALAAGNGWSPDRIRAVAVLNAFSRVVLGPLAACFARHGGHDLGHLTPVKHGNSLTVDDKTSVPFRAMLAEFDRIAAKSGVSEHWLHASRLDDIVFYMGRLEEDDDSIE